MDSSERGHSPLGEVGDPPHCHHRPDEHLQIGGESGKIAYGNGLVDYQAAAIDQNDQQTDIADQRRCRKQKTMDEGHSYVGVYVSSAKAVEIIHLASLVGIGFNQSDGNHS